MMHAFNLSREQNDTSLTLDFLRWFGAQLVCVGHALSFFGIADIFRPPFSPYMQNIGVLIFFVVSGFLIAHTLKMSLHSDPEHGFQKYMVSRFARIYSAFIPCMFIIALLDFSNLYFGGSPAGIYFSWEAFLGTLFLLNNYIGPFREVLAVPSFGSAAPLWSLAVEWHIYFFVGGLFFFFAGKKVVVPLLVAILFSSVPLAYFNQELHIGSALFYLWLFGFGIYFLVNAIDMKKFPLPLLFIMLAATVYYFFQIVIPKDEYRLLNYPVLAFGFLLLILMSQQLKMFCTSERFAKVVRLLADYSFTLYLLHYSVMELVIRHFEGDRTSLAIVTIVGVNLFSFMVALKTEMKHKALSNTLKKILFRKTPREEATI